MHRFLERLDAAASTVVPLLYLAGLMLGTLSYFANVQLGFTLAVGIALAFAAELHSFLALRRCRAIFGQLTRTTTDPDTRERLAAQLRVHVAILGALVAFSTFNSVAFVASTWHPTPGWLPAWAQIGIRGAIIPAFFLLAGFLSPLTADAGALLASASHDMLHRTIKATVKQWKRRVETARKRGLDLAPIAVALMLDAGDTDGARRVEMIARGLNVAEGISSAPAHATEAPTVAEATMPVGTPAAIAAPLSARSDANPPSDPPPPTGPGSPTVQTRRVQTRRTRKAPAVIRLQPVPAEERIRAALVEHPGASIKRIAEAAGVSSATASKWRKVVRAEQDQRVAQ